MIRSSKLLLSTLVHCLAWEQFGSLCICQLIFIGLITIKIWVDFCLRVILPFLRRLVGVGSVLELVTVLDTKLHNCSFILFIISIFRVGLAIICLNIVVA